MIESRSSAAAPPAWMPRGLASLGIAALALALGACSTQRTLTIHSDPPGADVWVDGTYRGKTPIEYPFVHYRTLAIRLEKEGHASVAREVEIPTLIDGYPVIDLPYELTVRERRFTWTGRLPPLAGTTDAAAVEEMLERARRFRQETLELGGGDETSTESGSPDADGDR